LLLVCDSPVLLFMHGLILDIKQLFITHRGKITDNRQTIRSIAALFGGNMMSSVLGAVGGVLVARFIGPDVAGLFRAYTIPLMYLTFLHLGTFDGLWRQIPYYVGKEMPEKVEALASSAAAWNLLMSLIVSLGFIACALYSLLQGSWFGVAGWLAQMLCCWGIFYGGYLGATYRTINQFVSLARIQLVQSVLNFGMILFIPFLGFYGLCVRSAVPSVAGVWLYHRARPLKIIYRFDRKALTEVIEIGLPFSFWGSLYTSIWTATESALMLYFGGVKGLGLFSVAVVIREGLNVLPQSVYQVMTPRVVEAYAREGSVRNANARSLWLTAGLTGFMVLVTIIASFTLDVLVPLVLPKYVEGIPLMKVCLWFAVIQAASLPLNTIFATGRSWLHGRGVIVGLAVFPLAAYILTPLLGGVLAVAIGSLLGRTARTIAAYLEIALLVKHEPI